MQLSSLPVSNQPVDNHLTLPVKIQPNNHVLHDDDKHPIKPIPVSNDPSTSVVEGQIPIPTSVVEDHPNFVIVRPINCSNGQKCNYFYALTDHRSGGMEIFFLEIIIYAKLM